MKHFDKIICVGKNYLDHAKELGDAIPDNPVIFLKPPSVLKEVPRWGETVSLSLPNLDNDTQYECEVVLKLSNGGSSLSVDEAQQALGFVSLGLDMTRRNLQSKLKQSGHPWTIAKVFKDSAVVGPWISVENFPDFMETEFSLSINNIIHQQAIPNQMIVNPYQLISFISTYFPLCENDLIFTGTPAGVDNVYPSTIATLKWGPYWYNTLWR